jgi:hypothetical protein
MSVGVGGVGEKRAKNVLKESYFSTIWGQRGRFKKVKRDLAKEVEISEYSSFTHLPNSSFVILLFLLM